MKQAAHRAPGDRDADVAIELLESVLGCRLTALADDQMSDEARRVPRLLSNARRRRSRDDVSASARESLALVDAFPEVRLHVFVDDGWLAVPNSTKLGVAAVRTLA